MFQALIAETVDPVEAMDLFRHTTELGNHVSCYLVTNKNRILQTAITKIY